MTANELANEFETLLKECEEHPWGNFEILYDLTATMLRQQQAEIEVLKKELALQRLSDIGQAIERELSDEKIWKLWQTHLNDDITVFARAILKKASEK